MKFPHQFRSLLLGVCILVQTTLAAAQQASPNFDFDGKYLVGITSKGPSGMGATVWSARNGELVQRIAHQESIVRVELAPDGNSVLTSSFHPPNELSIRSKDDSIRVWTIPGGKESLRIRNATYGQFSRDGKRIYGFSRRPSSKSSATTFDVSAWDSKDGKLIFTATLPGAGETLSSRYTLQENAGRSKLLYFGSGFMAVFDSVTGKPVIEPVRTIAGFSVLGLLTPSGDEAQVAEIRHVRYFSALTGGEVKKITFPLESAWWVGLQPTGQGFAAVSVFGDLVYYDRKTDRMTQAKSTMKSIGSVFVREDGRLFYVDWGGGYADGAAVPQIVTALDAETCKQVWERPGRIISRFGEDQLVILGWPEEVSIVHALSGAVLRKFMLRGFVSPSEE